jgi:hypothetical protein
MEPVQDAVSAVEAGSRGLRRAGPGNAATLRFRALSPLGTVGSMVAGLADRPFAWLFRLWLWVALGSATLFWLGGLVPGGALQQQGAAVRLDAVGAWTALYFSLVTATSVGYGDVVPLGPFRLVAVGECAATLLIFGCLISKIVSRRQEELAEETHRITFEARLGRVRTNLHLVLTDLQGIARLCGEGGHPPPRLRVRVESAASVFVGELRAVHDLLYRPDRAPDEEALAGILATVAAGLAEFRDLLMCMPADPIGPGLRGSLGTLNRLAQEVCSDCVPQVYAPDLRQWMDEIRDSGRALERLASGMP